MPAVASGRSRLSQRVFEALLTQARGVLAEGTPQRAEPDSAGAEVRGVKPRSERLHVPTPGADP